MGVESVRDFSFVLALAEARVFKKNSFENEMENRLKLFSADYGGCPSIFSAGVKSLKVLTFELNLR